jgi:hypothetical protein
MFRCGEARGLPRRTGRARGDPGSELGRRWKRRGRRWRCRSGRRVEVPGRRWAVERVIPLRQRRPALLGRGWRPVGCRVGQRYVSGRQLRRRTGSGRGWGCSGHLAGRRTGESIRVLGLMPSIPEEAQRTRTTALPELGVRDLRHGRRPDRRRRRRGDWRAAGNFHHGLSRRRRYARHRCRQRRRNWLRARLDGRGQRAQADDGTGKCDPGDVHG